jgi:hypothetical protein
MSPKKAKILKTVRGIDLTLRYTSDNGIVSLITQRQFLDQDGVTLAPVTLKLLERQVQPSTPAIPRLSGLKPRTVTTCFGSLANISGESNFTIIIPYPPSDTNHSQHLREIFEYVSPSVNLSPPRALDISYYGESKV